MKLEDLAYAIVQKVFKELEHTHHYVVPENIREAVVDKIKSELNSLIG